MGVEVPLSRRRAQGHCRAGTRKTDAPKVHDDALATRRVDCPVLDAIRALFYFWWSPVRQVCASVETKILVDTGRFEDK